HPERAHHPFLVENHGLRFGGADSHPSRFTLGCKLLQYMTGTRDLASTLQLRTAASTMEAENMVHSDSMSPASLGICEKLFRRSVQLPPLPADPTHHQVVIFTRVSKTYGRRSDETTTKLIIDFQPRDVLVPRALMDTLMLMNMVFVMDKL
ncbi:hypothetical protein L3Q82_009141, partial [Scortum barcoo]